MKLRCTKNIISSATARRPCVFAVVGRALARVLVHHHVEVLDRGPEAVDLGDGRAARCAVLGGRRQRQQHAAAQPVLRDPLHVLDRVVDVVQVDEPDPRAALGRLGAEVGEPAVVRADAREPERVVLGPRGWRDQHARRRTAAPCSGRSPRRRCRRSPCRRGARRSPSSWASCCRCASSAGSCSGRASRRSPRASPVEVVAVGVDRRAGVGVGGDHDVGSRIGRQAATLVEGETAG